MRKPALTRIKTGIQVEVQDPTVDKDNRPSKEQGHIFCNIILPGMQNSGDKIPKYDTGVPNPRIKQARLFRKEVRLTSEKHVATHHAVFEHTKKG